MGSALKGDNGMINIERKGTLEQALKVLAKKSSTSGLTAKERQQMLEMNRELSRIEIVEKCESDVALFAYEYFSDQLNADNKADNLIVNIGDKKHETIDEMAIIHRGMYDIADEITRKVKGRYAILAPRSHAKTTIISTITTLHELVYLKRKYALILSETDTLSKRILLSISTQLKYNDKLREDFGSLLEPIANKNEKDNEEAFVTSAGQLVEASSSGKAIRGKTFKGNRPDLIIADDLSSMNNEGTQAQREKLIDWWNASVTPLGAANCATVIVGTRVSASGLISNLMENRQYSRKKFSAIISPPKYPHLWSDYLHLYNTDASDEALDEFYEDNREAMEEGIVLAWPARWTYRDLMHEKASIGSKAFASEYLNESFADDEQFFEVDSYAMCERVFDNVYNSQSLRFKDKHYSLSGMDIVVAYDPALGASRRSDKNAAVVIGRDRESGKAFVLETLSRVCKPSDFIDDIFKMIQKYPRINKFRLEGIGAYRLLADEIEHKLRSNDMYTTRLDLITSHGSKTKQQRIESLQVPLENGGLILNAHASDLLSELQFYPHLANDDVIDALTMAYAGIRKGPVRRVQQKPSWL